ncbi:acyl-coenzyme A synthetase ACSM3, mitochondrial [Lingula anatina]|uniref:medium-chain acyl-CoA ligase n=1 Tax=Lingula anatina TaxID=7574 RepID=A0A1S3IPC4_LINAN|nr:acyl-coenzyme A synthetase ACSM3, mitochondrial [Lingula anatina]XP_023931813.1 acyl-coenzyme A synthetase ACSM3, mitochondrial [Lingula anatina]|eukprot:XP_013400062.1 acyl-coenzyme A synthetase ACSM3, mitochondrial [Lingula anatina]
MKRSVGQIKAVLKSERQQYKTRWQFSTAPCLLQQSAISGPAPSATGFNNYEEGRQKFQLIVPEKYNFARDVLDQWSSKAQHSARTALWWVDDYGQEFKWTFKHMEILSKRLANGMSVKCQLKAGDRVIVILPRLPEWWVINLACMRIGLVLCPGTVLLTPKDIMQRIQASGAKCIITDEAGATEVQKIARDCPTLKTKVVVGAEKIRPGWFGLSHLMEGGSTEHKCIDSLSSDPMTLFFTSGTTGLPKMVEHTHASYGMAHVITGKYWLDLTPEDIHWNMSDTGWAKSAWSSLFAPWIQGACIFAHHSPSFDAEQTLRMLEQYPISTFCTAPTAYRMFAQQDLKDREFKALRHCLSAGEPLNPEVTEVWEEHTKHTIREGYGQTETVLLCGSFRCLQNKPGSMGKPAPGYDIQVIDQEGNELEPGQEGNIAVKYKPDRPVGLFTGYLDDEERTSASFHRDYYLTGDRAYCDEEGYLWFVGRSDDVIISAGYRIGPFEVESALIEHPAVVESAVVSSPDETRGEVVKAFIVLSEAYKTIDKDNLTKELQEHVKKSTAPYKYPRKVEFVEQLPKTVSGKIRRVELREKEHSKEK